MPSIGSYHQNKSFFWLQTDYDCFRFCLVSKRLRMPDGLRTDRFFDAWNLRRKCESCLSCWILDSLLLTLLLLEEGLLQKFRIFSFLLYQIFLMEEYKILLAEEYFFFCGIAWQAEYSRHVRNIHYFGSLHRSFRADHLQGILWNDCCSTCTIGNIWLLIDIWFATTWVLKHIQRIQL